MSQARHFVLLFCESFVLMTLAQDQDRVCTLSLTYRCAPSDDGTSLGLSLYSLITLTGVVSIDPEKKGIIHVCGFLSSVFRIFVTYDFHRKNTFTSTPQHPATTCGHRQWIGHSTRLTQAAHTLHAVIRRQLGAGKGCFESPTSTSYIGRDHDVSDSSQRVCQWLLFRAATVARPNFHWEESFAKKESCSSMGPENHSKLHCPRHLHVTLQTRQNFDVM